MTLNIQIHQVINIAGIKTMINSIKVLLRKFIIAIFSFYQKIAKRKITTILLMMGIMSCSSPGYY
jgi:hypothetical protein